MQHNGWQTVTVASYADFKNAVNGQGWDLDQSFGDQCYDIAFLLWYSLGFPAGYPVNGGTGNAYDIWTQRSNNIEYGGTTYFQIIDNLDDVKQGDVLVYDQFSLNPFGHVGLADEDYSTWSSAHPGDYEFPILSQNNGGTPYAGGGSYANIHGYDTRLFLGAFRVLSWAPTPPPPPRKKKKFPWVLYARRFRERRS